MSVTYTITYAKDTRSYQVPVMLSNGTKQHMGYGVLDTGADCCGVTEEVAKDLGLKVIGEKTVRGATGELTVEPLYEMLLNVGMLDYRKVKAVRCRKGTDGSEVIIGKNFLDKCDIVITHPVGKTMISMRFSTGDPMKFWDRNVD